MIISIVKAMDVRFWQVFPPRVLGKHASIMLVGIDGMLFLGLRSSHLDLCMEAVTTDHTIEYPTSKASQEVM